MRPRNLVAGTALTAALALVALPGFVDSRVPSRDWPIDAAAFQQVTTASDGGSSLTIGPLDDAQRSADALTAESRLIEPGAGVKIPVSKPKFSVPSSAVDYDIKPPRYKLTGTATFYDNGTTAMRLPGARSSGSADRPARASTGSSTTTARSPARIASSTCTDRTSSRSAPARRGRAREGDGLGLLTAPEPRRDAWRRRAVSFGRPFNDRSREAGKEEPERATHRSALVPAPEASASGGVPMTGRRIMTADEIRRAVVRISHELVEKHGGTAGLALVGIQRRGVPLARRIADAVFEHEGVAVPVGALDITFYRDDLSLVAAQPVVKGTDLPFDLNDTHGRARRRRPVHGPHDPGRDGRARGLRAAAGDPPGGARGPRPSRAARSVPTTSARTCRRPARRSSASTSRRPTARTTSRSSVRRRPGRRGGRVSLGLEPPAEAAAGTGGREPPSFDRPPPVRQAAPGGHLAPSPPARRRRPVVARHRARDAHDRRDARGPARPIAKVPALRGTNVTILFYEASTRTRVSFEVAAKNLSADVVNIAAASSSVSKGESLIDTVRTVEALGARMLVMRHATSGAP